MLSKQTLEFVLEALTAKGPNGPLLAVPLQDARRAADALDEVQAELLEATRRESALPG